MHERKNGKFIMTDGGKANRIAEWFAEYFKSLKNGRASGPHQIGNELLKFAGNKFFKNKHSRSQTLTDSQGMAAVCGCVSSHYRYEIVIVIIRWIVADDV